MKSKFKLDETICENKNVKMRNIYEKNENKTNNLSKYKNNIQEKVTINKTNSLPINHNIENKNQNYLTNNNFNLNINLFNEKPPRKIGVKEVFESEMTLNTIIKENNPKPPLSKKWTKLKNLIKTVIILCKYEIVTLKEPEIDNIINDYKLKHSSYLVNDNNSSNVNDEIFIEMKKINLLEKIKILVQE